MTRRALVASILASSVALAAAVVACRRTGPDWRIVQLYSGETTVDLLQHPSKVQAFPLDATGRATAPGEAHAGPYAATAAPVDVPADAAAELSKILFDADSYDWRRGPKDGSFRPQVGLWFVRGSYQLEISLDLESERIAVHAGGQPLGPVLSIEPARARLTEIAKKLLPNDAAVRALR